jgi:hypothetical protein
MHSCRRVSDKSHAPVEQTTLLYKEVAEFLPPSWHKQPADAPELFCLRHREAARNLAAGECVVCS